MPARLLTWLTSMNGTNKMELKQELKQTLDWSNVTFMTDEQIQAEKHAFDVESRTEQLAKILPKAFAQTKRAMLDQEALEQAMMWAEYPHKQPLNLVLAGSTGVGKTRIAWEAIAERYVQHGGRPIAIGAESLARRAFREHELIDKLAWAKLVLLDDLGKEKTTPTAESTIFEVIRERTDNQLPTIFTTNFSPKTLLPRFQQKETGEAICRRMTDDSTIVTFEADQRKASR